MEKRQRISSNAKWTILISAVLVDIFSFFFGLIALIPYVGLFGSIAGFVLSILWTFVLTLWLFSIGTGLKRLWVRIGLIFGLQAMDLMVSLFPFLGELVSAGIVFVNTLLLYFLIRAVEKEDKEYNKLQEKKAEALQKADDQKKRTLVEKQYDEEERRLAEKSVLNKKNA